MRKMIISHRGVSGGEPENTLEAFAAAVARGLEGIELDVRSTADGALVIFHDSSARGVRGRSVARSTREELATLVPGLCTLGETLDVIPPTCLLDVEIKVAGIERAVLDVLEPRRRTSAFVITSFQDETVARVKALDSTIRVGLILGEGRPKSGLRARISEVFPGARLRRCESDFVVANWKLLRFGFLRRMGRLGYPVWVWTVNEPERMIRMLGRPEVAAIITGRPLEAMALREGLDSSPED